MYIISLKKNIVISQTYVLDIINETSMIDYKHVNCSMNLNQKLIAKQRDSFSYHKI